jgi:hypothetical protein
MPVLHPAEFWHQTWRRDYRVEMTCHLNDRASWDLCLAMTHEAGRRCVLRYARITSRGILAQNDLDLFDGVTLEDSIDHIHAA